MPNAKRVSAMGLPAALAARGALRELAVQPDTLVARLKEDEARWEGEAAQPGAGPCVFGTSLRS